MHSIDYEFLKKRITHNTRQFNKMVRRAARSRTEYERIVYAIQAAHFAISHAISVYSSEHLEKIFLDCAAHYHTQLSPDFQKGNVLHVLTEAYTIGGHTRCVERWMELADTSEQHSCILLSQKNIYPSQLKEAAERTGGKFIVWEGHERLLERALKLRHIASAFEYVVLHVHPDDPTALLAFGTEEFKRPVLFFNHADHIFWLGVSIADCVADLSSRGRETSLRYRKAARAEFLGIPLDRERDLSPDAAFSREKLGIAPAAKIVFSSGSPSKYLPVGDDAFFEAVDFLLASDKDVLVAIAGVPPDNKHFIANAPFRKVKKKYQERLLMPGKLDYAKEYRLWLACADLVLDSFPVGGGTAVIDAITSAKPVLMMNKYPPDFLVQSSGVCGTLEEFQTKSLKILQDPGYAQKIASEQQVLLNKYNGPQAWKGRLKNIVSIFPKIHHLYHFHTSENLRDVTEHHINVCRWIQPDIAKVFSLNKLLKYICTIKWNKEIKYISILKFDIVNKRNDI